MKQAATRPLLSPRTVSNSSRVLVPAAWLAIGATVASISLLIALHGLSPEFSPSWRMISEYAFGPYAWMLSLMFLSSGIGCWALALAIWSEASGKQGKTGLSLLILSGLGGALASVFDIRHPTGHLIAGLLGVLSFPIAALLLSSALGRNERWRTMRRTLLSVANVSWVSVVLLVVTLAIMTLQMMHVTGGQLPSHAPKTLPAGVLAIDGWADRMIVVSNWIWVLLSAWHVVQLSDEDLDRYGRSRRRRTLA